MSLWQSILNVLTFQEPQAQVPFELLETGEDTFPGSQSNGQNPQNQGPLQIQPSSASAAKDNPDNQSKKQQPMTDQPSQAAGMDADQDQANAEAEQPPSNRLARQPVLPAKIEDPFSLDIVQTVYAKKKKEQDQERQVIEETWPKKPAGAVNSPNPQEVLKGHRKHRPRGDKQRGSGAVPSPSQSNSSQSGSQTEGKAASNQSVPESSPKAASKQGQDSRQPQDNVESANGSGNQDPNQDKQIFSDLEQNLSYLADVFYWPTDVSLTAREFVVGTNPPLKGIALYFEGLADPSRINQTIIEPLMVLSHLTLEEEKTPQIRIIKQRLLTAAAVQTKEKFTEIIEAISGGSTVLFFQGIPQALSVETSGWPRRGVEQPVSERVIRGPQEAFNEDLAANVSMIRRLLRDPKLNRENLKVGLRAHNQCALLYIEDLANPVLIKEIRRRINSLEVDAVLSSGALEQLIQDNSWGIYPLSMATERPDRVVASLLDGKAVVFLEGDPFALVYPSDVWSLLHAAEDSSISGPAVTVIRLIRWLSAGMLLFLPGMYLAIVGFHPEMLPTDLLLSIAANRERVPFPSVVEVLLMELAFELIREAGVRIPGVIGPTLGIVGAIILGQAAVAANLVNPIVIIIVAITGISSFAIPSYSLTITLRVYRFFYILLGSTLGLLGMAAGVTFQFILIVSLKSMGAPYLAPLGPFTFSNKDILARGMLWNQERRPDYLGARDQYRQSPISRKWVLNPANQGREKQP